MEKEELQRRGGGS